jgi:dienelactone hydrolase
MVHDRSGRKAGAWLKLPSIVAFMACFAALGMATECRATEPDRLPSQAGQPEIHIEVLRPTTVGPVPVAIMLHSGAGLADQGQRDGFREWARWLQKLGVASVIVDSFRGRNIRSTFGFIQNRDAYWDNLGLRVVDAERAIQWLRTQGWANPAQVFLFGQSQGGATALRLVGQSTMPVPVIAFYPAICTDRFVGQLESNSAAARTYPRSLWLIANDDTSVSARDCMSLANKLGAAGVPAGVIEAVVLSDAAHGFDWLTGSRGAGTSMVVKFSAEARDESRRLVHRFLKALGYVL